MDYSIILQSKLQLIAVCENTVMCSIFYSNIELNL